MLPVFVFFFANLLSFMGMMRQLDPDSRTQFLTVGAMHMWHALISGVLVLIAASFTGLGIFLGREDKK